MANEGDMASDYVEHAMEVAMNNREASKENRPKPTGFCLNCKDRVSEGAFYCDDGGECRDDHEKRLRMKGY